MNRTGIAPQGFYTLIKPEVADILGEVSGFLDELGIKAYLVGGFVRDMLLGRETADIDIAVAGNALEIAAKAASVLGGKYVPLDEANRVARVILITPAGDQWQFDFTSFGGDIEQDLARRDFTIDAMAVDLNEFGTQPLSAGLIDPFHGWDDLRRRLVRVVSETAFTADAARLLRAVRLAAELDFTLDKATEALVRRDSHLVSGVAGERTREELLRLLAIPRAELLTYLDGLGLLAAIIPELSQAK
ncbi:MAG: metal-dependent phosphohydrolase, partial [Chloroflexota bacterium]|nr:metal-dependent phosphohydrolase [Chloroflexota bacterium]